MMSKVAERIMRECIAEAQKAIESGNPPFGCVITNKYGNIKARAHNTQESDNDPTGHAEINAMRKLGTYLKSRYLDGYIMFSNAACCSMCMSCAVKAHITNFYFGAPPEPSLDPYITMEEIATKSTRIVNIQGAILENACVSQITYGRKINP